MRKNTSTRNRKTNRNSRINRKNRRNKKTNRTKRIRHRRQSRQSGGNSCITPQPDCFHKQGLQQLSSAGHSQTSECAHSYRYDVGGSKAGSGGKRFRKSFRNSKRHRIGQRKQKGGNCVGHFLNMNSCPIGGQAEIGRYDSSVHQQNRYNNLYN